jgi:hypothetical protein
MEHCVCRRSASLISFVLSYFVIAGLGPAIHAATKLPLSFRKLHVSMDHRVKPGGDEERGCLTLRLAKLARQRAARMICLARPRRAGSGVT